ncbi:MAG: putative cyclohex-ene-carboxylate:CoA ligase [Aeromicrobium sp.]|nr:putative cyclohex-ene-carboxylate:CoA ligase [Aeromicrobium sp.]
MKTAYSSDAVVPATSSRGPQLWPWQIDAPTIDDLLRRRASSTPTATALIDEDGARVTYAELDARVSRVAAALASHGIRAGSRVAWQLPTRVSTVLVMAALRRLDAVQAPIIPLYREREVAVALATSEAEFFLVPGVWKGFDFAAMAHGLELDRSPHILEIGYDAPEAESANDLTSGFAPHSADDARWIYFTSGSTGAPKGAMHSDKTLLTTGYAFGGMGGLGREPDEVAAMGFPIAHVGGIEYLIAAWSGGYPVLLLEAFVPPQAVAQMKQHRVTTTGGAPPFYQAFAALARACAPEPLLPTLRSLKGGGAPCPAALFDEVLAVLGIAIAHDYGMTEAPMMAVADPSDPTEILAETDGKPIPGNEMRLVSADGSDVAPGESGQIEVRGAGVCHGYTDPAETAKAFSPDGWLRTGDLGRLHPSGHLEVVGRLKDTIIRKGENIVPQEIEALLAEHPSVAEVAVIGLPDGDRGELVCAVVTAAPAASLDLPSATEWLAARGLMRQKLPERLELVDALPRTGLSKIAKAELVKRYSDPDPANG